MSICKISDIKDRVGTVIPSISGTIVSVFPAKEGKGQHGAWKLQNIKIQDESGECAVTLSGLEESLQEFHKGKNIEFESVGTKFGLKGVSCEKRDYVDKKGNNVSSIGVKVTKTAKIRLEGAGMVQEDAKDDIKITGEYPDENPSNIVAALSYDKAIKNINKESVRQNIERNTKTPEERIAQFGKLYEMCLTEASKTITAALESKDPESLRSCASCYFIQAVKEGLADKMEMF